MNRNKPEKLPKIQIQFLKSVCIPLYKVNFFINFENFIEKNINYFVFIRV
jgi:hypothetical protein